MIRLLTRFLRRVVLHLAHTCDEQRGPRKQLKQPATSTQSAISLEVSVSDDKKVRKYTDFFENS